MGGAPLAPGGLRPAAQRVRAFAGAERRGRGSASSGPRAATRPEDVANFYRAFSGHHDCEPSDLGLFERTVADLREFVLDQDVVYVGGGNTVALLAVWRAHGLDAVMREAWEPGWSCAG